ncbi:MAG: TIGR04086 family membrane protein [Eubacteriales bacterium]|nr:TIGR04086 family membrane protein [Eubacteriales bacterium]
MNRTEGKDGRAVLWAAPMLLGLLLIFGGTLAGAALLSAGALGQQLAPLAAYVPLALGGFTAAFWGARRAPVQKFLMGMLIGILLLGCLLVLGLTLRDAAFMAPTAGTTAGILLAASLLGAIPGAAAKKKKRRR